MEMTPAPALTKTSAKVNVTIGSNDKTIFEFYTKRVKDNSTGDINYELHANCWGWGLDASAFTSGSKYTCQIGLFNDSNFIDWMVEELAYTSQTATNTWTCTDKVSKSSSSQFDATSDSGAQNCMAMSMKSITSFNGGKAYFRGHFMRKFETGDADDLALKLGTIKANLKVTYPGQTFSSVDKELVLLDPDASFARGLKAVVIGVVLGVISSVI